jgi:hypothetical protein
MAGGAFLVEGRFTGSRIGLGQQRASSTASNTGLAGGTGCTSMPETLPMIMASKTAASRPPAILLSSNESIQLPVIPANSSASSRSVRAGATAVFVERIYHECAVGSSIETPQPERARQNVARIAQASEKQVRKPLAKRRF